MTMSCPEVMYGAYYPYLYGRAAGPAARASSFASPFTAHQYDRFNVQTSQTLPQELYGGGAASSGLCGAQSSLGHSSGGSVSSGGGAPPSPGSPPVPHVSAASLAARLHAKEEDLSVQGRSSTEVAAAHGSSDSESEGGPAGVASASSSGGARAQYVSANCVVFTHYSGDVAAVVDEHFSRALSYAEKGHKESSPMSSRNFPASFWNSHWQPPASMAGVAGMAGVTGDLYSDAYHAHDPWTQHYQQYTAAAAHHHRAVHEYHHHHHNMAAAAQYSGLLLPPARLPHHAAPYSKGTMDWSASHTSRLHHDQATAAHHSHAHALESAAAYSSYPSMAGLEAQVQESSKDLYWF